ncbi:hypothetical protein AWC31_35280 [Mycolicibacterium wolinskyi]|uniref:Uncharacterized protein n=2 Tax=Mycobacteriaceae TaxID=1762 RepID=A0A1X2F0J5_9MYCO|nr:hypothetical protein AWC31_35280 [Mycolicibacterium wolinskyi]
MTNGCKQMKTTLYHEIEPQTLDDVRRNGLKRKGDGEKSDSDTKTADAYLDTHRPPETIRAQLCRDGVLYGFLPAGDGIVDIRNGAAVDIATFDRDRPQTLLRIAVDPTHCFVSDLDLYDRVKRALKTAESDDECHRLAQVYWQRVIPLLDYEPGSIRRPEAMVVADIEPADIEVVSPDG